jgi:cytochrome o ubiquinol oxidase subunit 2
MLCVVVPVILLTLFFSWRYRASNPRAAYRPDFTYSGKIELVVWSIPAMVVILLAGVGWIGSHQLDPARKLESNARPIRIQVVALDWKWLFIYPELEIATVNYFTIPIGTPIEFLLTSATVMNDFFVPQLGSQIYAMPGMTTHLNLMADRAGDYPGLAAHFSGDGFADMRIAVHALPAGEFDAWLAKARGALVLDGSTYERLARAGLSGEPQTYRSVDPGLFERILRNTVRRPPRPRMEP